MIPARVFICLALGGVVSCSGTIGDATEPGSGDPDNPYAPDSPSGRVVAGLPGRELATTLGLRRLATDEYDNTVRDLLGQPTRLGTTYLPKDVRKPFDDYRQQSNQISDSLIQSVELLADDIAWQLVVDTPRRDRIVGCRATDAGCLKQFVTRFGQRALRRPLTDAEIALFTQLPTAAGQQGDFNASVETIVRAFLQTPEFLHRIEIGAPVSGVPGLYKLDGWEMASRLSYFLTGSMPTDALFERAANGGLATPADVRAAAAETLAQDPRARERVARFHALWLGYANLTHAYAVEMNAETEALLARVVFEQKRPWQDVFRSDQTFATYDLARLYGLRIPAELKPMGKAAWVPYTGTSRRGLLSHGSFLSFGAKFGDTSPTVRGKSIRERLFCQHMPTPEEAGIVVNTDVPPKNPNPSLCKWDRYEANRATAAACKSCHEPMDLVGFGLENYDTLGKYRSMQYWTKDSAGLAVVAAAGTAGAERCAVKNQGVLDGQTFSGAAGLGDLMLASPNLNSCVVRELYRFGTSRNDMNDSDKKFVDLLLQRIGDKEFRLDELLLDFVSSPAFAHRRVDTAK